MQIDVIYNNGRIEWPDRIRFIHQRFKVRIDVPNEEIEVLPPPIKTIMATTETETIRNAHVDLHPDTLAVIARLEAIKESMLAIPDDHFQKLPEKQEEMICAFRSREDR